MLDYENTIYSIAHEDCAICEECLDSAYTGFMALDCSPKEAFSGVDDHFGRVTVTTGETNDR
jgi:hypothetical protein